MAEEITVSSELIERLIERIESLEKKFDEKESKNKKKKRSGKKASESIGDATEDVVKESGRITGSFIDAAAEALKQGADALSELSEETDKEKLGRVPAAIVSVFRRAIDIQSRALEKFEESYEEYDD